MVVFKRVACFFLVLCSCYSEAANPYVVAGSAYDVKSGKLVYRELIAKLDNNNNVDVNYVRPNGVIFARKTLNFNTEIFQPAFTFTDERDDETLEAHFDGGKLLLARQVKDQLKTKTLYDTANLVIDAGLDSYIQRNWNKLTSGKKLEFELVNARFLGTDKFVLKEIDASESPLANKGADKSWKYFKLDVSNRLSSLLSESAYFAYQPDGLFLMSYQGTANIDSDNGEPWIVRMEYEYF